MTFILSKFFFAGTLTQAIRNFAKSLEGWLKAAISHCGEDILNIKVRFHAFVIPSTVKFVF